VRALASALDVLGIVLPVEEGGSSPSDEEGSSSSDEEASNNTSLDVRPINGFQKEVSSCVLHLQGLMSKMVTLVDTIDSIVTSGDLGASRIAYESARIEYEQIEVLSLFSEILIWILMQDHMHFKMAKRTLRLKAFTKLNLLGSVMEIWIL
jgi:hypothetical protein